MGWRNNYKTEKEYLGIEEGDDSHEELLRAEIWIGKPPPWINNEGFIPGAVKDGIKYYIFGPWFFLWRFPYYLLEAWNRSPFETGGCKRIYNGYYVWPSSERSWLWLCAVLALGIYFVYSMGDPDFRVWFWRLPQFHVQTWFVGWFYPTPSGGLFEFNPADHEWRLHTGVWAPWWETPWSLTNW